MPHAHQDPARLNAFAASRGGVVSLEELAGFGFSSRVVGRRVMEGRWQRMGRAVILASPREPSSAGENASSAHEHLSDTQWSWVVHHTFGSVGGISGRPALARAGWHVPRAPVIAVLPHKASTSIAGLSVLRRTPADVRRLADGRCFLGPVDALLDCLIVLDAGAAADLLDTVLQQRLVDPEALALAVERRVGHGRRGATRLRMTCARAMSGSRSEAEQRMAALLARSSTGPWSPNHPVRDESGRIIAEIDFAHEGLRIAIEVDGRAHHTDRRSFERDRRRQNDLMLRGWLVLRFTWEQITERPDEVLSIIAAAVRQRAA